MEQNQIGSTVFDVMIYALSIALYIYSIYALTNSYVHLDFSIHVFFLKLVYVLTNMSLKILEHVCHKET